MIRKHDYLLGALVRIGTEGNPLFQSSYDGLCGIVIAVPELEAARPWARVLHHDGRILAWLQSDLCVMSDAKGGA